MNELDLKIEEYESFFEEEFPTFQFMTRTMDETIKIIDECIDSGMTVYDMGFVTDDPDVQY